MSNKRHIISLLLQNEVGALARVAGLFSNRGYNIESLNVATTDDPTVSRLTLVTTGTDAVLAQIVSQSLKLVDVVNVDDMTRDAHIERELLLVKLKAQLAQSQGFKMLLTSNHAEVLSDDGGNMVVELVDSEARINDFIRAVAQHADVLEVVRSGALAILKGGQTLRN
jgi:acetolactate synthase I/III small subunit